MASKSKSPTPTVNTSATTLAIAKTFSGFTDNKVISSVLLTPGKPPAKTSACSLYLDDGLPRVAGSKLDRKIKSSIPKIPFSRLPLLSFFLIRADNQSSSALSSYNLYVKTTNRSAVRISDSPTHLIAAKDLRVRPVNARIFFDSFGLKPTSQPKPLAKPSATKPTQSTKGKAKDKTTKVPDFSKATEFPKGYFPFPTPAEVSVLSPSNQESVYNTAPPVRSSSRKTSTVKAALLTTKPKKK